ncbi:glycosyltransferase 87 family protein [Kitasatospora sp. NPDC101801]|uniref:glycosyltransferase 87 family protein n=1 Tax=Kitasatospora sp. NPDC101801 TaxID=3364103 RepID=UPI003811927E
MSETPRSARATWPAVLALAALATALAGTVTRGGTLGDRDGLYGWYALDAVLFALAVVLLRRMPPSLVPSLVLAGSVVVAATGLLAPPRTSDDAYRYLWDGRVQAAGISPYDHAPDAPELAELRWQATELFPPGGDCAGWDERRTAAGECSHLNRPGVHTVYPPVAEGWFAGLYALGGRYGVRAAQVGGALLAVATTGVLLVVLRRLGAGPSWRAALWGWFPGVAVWAVNDAHVDTLGVLLLVVSLAAAGRGRPVIGGALLGLSIATKLVPVLALPGALSGLFARRPRLRDLTLPLAAAAALALSYLPYLLASGPAVLGYLPGYLREEGYDQDHVDRFGLLRLILPDRPAIVAGVLVILAVAGWVLFRGDPARPWSGALLVTGTALLVLAPGYPWYGLLVVALVVLDGRWEWLAVPAAAQVLYLAGGQAQQLAYGAALLVALAGAVGRRRGAARVSGDGRR